MMIDFLNRRSRFSILIMLLLSFLTSCSRGNREVAASLDRIEQVVEQHPDSALIELVRLDSLLDAGAVSIEGDRQMARYALLKTQTHDKNYIDDTSDSLILRAVRYYDEHGSKREQMLAHFYHGSIQRNNIDYALAFTSFYKAVDLAYEPSDKTWQGMAYLNLSLICRMLGSVDAISYADSAYHCFSVAGASHRMEQALVYKATALSYYKQNEEAKRLFEYVISHSCNSITTNECIRQYIDLCVNMGDFEKGNELFDRLSPPFSFLDYSNRVYVDINRKDIDRARQDLLFAKELIQDARDSVFYLAAMRNVCYQTSDYRGAYDALARKSFLQDSLVRAMSSHSVASVQKELLYQQNLHIQYVSAQQQKQWVLVSILILMIVAWGISYVIQKRKEHKQEIDAYVVSVSILQQTLFDRDSDISALHQYIESRQSAHLFREEALQIQVRNLFSKSFRDLNILCTSYFNNKGRVDEQQIIYENVLKLIKGFASPVQQKELEHIIDQHFNNVMQKARSLDIGLSDEDFLLYRLKVAGFSYRSIGLLMKQENPDTIKKRVQRLKAKILQSGSPFSVEIASLL